MFIALMSGKASNFFAFLMPFALLQPACARQAWKRPDAALSAEQK
jgi:hypothetical protein